MLQETDEKQNVPASEATNATLTRIHVGVPAANRIASMTPKRHQASVPAVEGETNLLLVSVCMINPEIDSPVPAMMIASVRGIRLIRPIKRSSSLPDRKPARLKSCTPVAMESTVSTTSETQSPKDCRIVPFECIDQNPQP